MSDHQGSARIEVQLDQQDILHLLKHGKATSTKQIGPMEVRVTTEQQIRPTIVVDSRDEDPEEVLE